LNKLRRLKRHDEEKLKLKQLAADHSLDEHVLRDAVKNLDPLASARFAQYVLSTHA
jgi:hypothetical protein